jgi:hypothetical protein
VVNLPLTSAVGNRHVGGGVAWVAVHPLAANVVNVWGLPVMLIGGLAIYVGVRGTQSKVWQMLAGPTAAAASTTTKAVAATLPTAGGTA